MEVATTEEHNKREISVVGRSGCRLSINMKCVGKRTNAVKNCGYFPACNAVVMLKIKARSICTRTEQRIRAKKFTAKLGLNFAGNVDLTKISIKNLKKKCDFCCFSVTSKTVIFVVVEIQTLIFCKNR